MIEFTKAYKTPTGVYDTLEAAQTAELVAIFLPQKDQLTALAVADLILKNSEAIINILTTTKKSRPRGRAANGATRKKRKQPAAPQADLPLGGTARLPKKVDNALPPA